MDDALIGELRVWIVWEVANKAEYEEFNKNVFRPEEVFNSGV